MIAQHKPTIIGAMIGAAIVTLAILARTAWAATAAPEPSRLDDVLTTLGPLGRAALGGLACLGVARLLAEGRTRWGWLRRGWTGNAAAALYGALTAFGAVLALGGSIGSGLVAVGGATVAGMGLARDPVTAQMPRDVDESEMVP